MVQNLWDESLLFWENILGVFFYFWVNHLKVTLNGTLTIHDIKEFDVGTIRCTAHNHLGTFSYCHSRSLIGWRIRLFDQWEWDVRLKTFKGLEQATFSLVILKPPVFKRELGTHRVKFGDLFELRCELEDTFPKESFHKRRQHKVLLKLRIKNSGAIIIHWRTDL